MVTDDQGFILGLPDSFTGPDFDAAGVGVCFVYNLAYTGEVTGLTMGSNIADITGCFDLSNGIYVNSCLLYTSPSPRDQRGSRMPSSA